MLPPSASSSSAIIFLVVVLIATGILGQGQQQQQQQPGLNAPSWIPPPPLSNLSCPTCPFGFTHGGSPSFGNYCPPCVPIRQTCVKGFYLEGQQCLPCPCRAPGAYCERRSSAAGAGETIACICPPGYEGSSCGKCSKGYVKQQYYPFYCLPAPAPGPPLQPQPLPLQCPGLPGFYWPNCTLQMPPVVRPPPFIIPQHVGPEIFPPAPVRPPWRPIWPNLCPPCPITPLHCPSCRPGCSNCGPYIPPPPPPPPPIPPILPLCPPCRFPPYRILCPPQQPQIYHVVCPVPKICPIPITPGVKCPFLPICPIPLPSAPPCRQVPICPIPIIDCNTNVTCPPCGGEICEPCRCDPRGTAIQDRKTCICKTNVEGASCESCKVGFFGLRHSNPAGCLKCFCSGVTDTCGVRALFNNTGAAAAVGWDREMTCDLTNTLGGDQVIFYDSQGTRHHGRTQRLRYSQTGSFNWTIPSRLCRLENFLDSYGMHLIVSLEVSSSPISTIDIILEGTPDFTIIWTAQGSFTSGRPLLVKLDDTAGWVAVDNQIRSRKATRDDIMAVLASPVRIILRFSASGLDSTSILDVALERGTTREPANSNIAQFTQQIEDCSCPVGYSGHSCEKCSANFYRDTHGRPHGVFGACKRCPCNRGGCRVDGEGNVQCLDDPCKLKGPVSVSLKPSHVKCCFDEVVVFTCLYESGEIQLELEFETEPKYDDLEPRQEMLSTGRVSSKIITASIMLKRGLVKVKCFGKAILDGELVTLHEATSIIRSEDCPESLLPPIPPTLITRANPKVLCYYINAEIEVSCSASLSSRIGGASSNVYGLKPMWSRAEGHLKRVPVVDTSSVGSTRLHIKRATLDDSGTYYCWATSQQDSLVQLDVVVVQIQNRTSEYCNPRVMEYPLYEQDDELGRGQAAGVTSALVAGPRGQALTTTTPASVQAKPSLVIEPAILHVYVGDFAQFHCKLLDEEGESAAAEGLSFYWRKKDGAGATNVGFGGTNGEYLERESVEKKDQGEYYCIGTNAHGKGSAKGLLIVHEKEAHAVGSTSRDSTSLRITVYPPAEAIKPGVKVELSCQGGSHGEVNWSKENGVISTNAIYEVQANNNQMLILPSVTLDDAGWYTCTGGDQNSRSNGASDSARAPARFNLVVKSEPVELSVKISPPSPLFVKPGVKVQLKCAVSTDGVGQLDDGLVVAWSRITSTVNGPMEQILLESQTKRLIYEITHVTHDDEGDYICAARNGAGGQAEGKLVLKVGQELEHGHHHLYHRRRPSVAG